MFENGILKRLRAGKPTINCWLSMESAFAAELLAEQGFDSLTVDLQHGLSNISGAIAAFQAMRASGVTPVARVPWLEPGAIMKTLDIGAHAIICPMINNRSQAEQFVSYMKYPPDGIRSFGPTRAAMAAGDNYAAEANGSVLSFAMIETREGFDNVEEIVSTPGLDGVYIGPADLALGLTDGRLAPGFDRKEEEMISAIRRILASAQSAGILAGLHCGSPEYAAKAVSWGFGLVTLSTDARLLAGAAAHALRETRQIISGASEGK